MTAAAPSQREWRHHLLDQERSQMLPEIFRAKQPRARHQRLVALQSRKNGTFWRWHTPAAILYVHGLPLQEPRNPAFYTNRPLTES